MLRSVTATSGTTAPLESLTTLMMAPLTVWAETPVGVENATSAKTSRSEQRRTGIGFPSWTQLTSGGGASASIVLISLRCVDSMKVRATSIDFRNNLLDLAEQFGGCGAVTVGLAQAMSAVDIHL